MKKIYRLLMVLTLATVTYPLYSQVSIAGPRTVCSGQTATYTVTGPTCMVQIDGPEGLDYGTFYHTAGTWTFDITWTNSTPTNKTDNFKIYISNDYWAGCDEPYYAEDMSVTIKPNVGSVSTPSTPTLAYVDGRLYTFTTSSSNATNYEWVVTGGSISGSTTGSTIKFLRSTSSCTFSAKVRGYAPGCSGNVYSAYSGVKSFTVQNPPFSAISGQTYLYPNTTYTYTPTFSTTTSEQGSVTAWSLSDPGGKLSWYPSGNTAYVSTGAPSSTLIFASITCTVTIANSCGTKTITQSLMYGGATGMSAGLGEKSQSAREARVFPNPSNAGQELTLEVPAASEIDSYIILNKAGGVISQNNVSILQGEQVTLQGSLPPGIYYVKLMRKGEMVETKKVIVK